MVSSPAFLALQKDTTPAAPSFNSFSMRSRAASCVDVIAARTSRSDSNSTAALHPQVCFSGVFVPRCARACQDTLAPCQNRLALQRVDVAPARRRGLELGGKFLEVVNKVFILRVEEPPAMRMEASTRPPGSRQRVWVATVLVSVLAVASVVALAARLSSPGLALLSVAGMEKEDKLRHELSEKVRCVRGEYSASLHRWVAPAYHTDLGDCALRRAARSMRQRVILCTLGQRVPV